MLVPLSLLEKPENAKSSENVEVAEGVTERLDVKTDHGNTCHQEIVGIPSNGDVVDDAVSAHLHHSLHDVNGDEDGVEDVRVSVETRHDLGALDDFEDEGGNDYIVDYVFESSRSRDLRNDIKYIPDGCDADFVVPAQFRVLLCPIELDGVVNPVKLVQGQRPGASGVAQLEHQVAPQARNAGLEDLDDSFEVLEEERVGMSIGGEQVERVATAKSPVEKEPAKLLALDRGVLFVGDSEHHVEYEVGLDDQVNDEEYGTRLVLGKDGHHDVREAERREKGDAVSGCRTRRKHLLSIGNDNEHVRERVSVRGEKLQKQQSQERGVTRRGRGARVSGVTHTLLLG